MEFIQLPKTDLTVSRLIFGCEPLGGTDWGRFDETLAMQAVSIALDLGINFFDTADAYGLGRSERVLSAALGERRHDAVILSKFGVNWEDSDDGGRAVTFLDSSPHRVFEAVEGSLRRLRIDSIPLYLVHWPDPSTPIDQTMEALSQCIEAGKIQYVGVSNFPPHLIRTANRVTDVAAVELPYSLANREAERTVLPCCQELGISTLVYGSLAQGLLTGKYGLDTEFGPDDRRSRLDQFKEKKLEQNLELVTRLRQVGKCHGKTPAQTAIRWVLDNPMVDCVVVGIKTPDQLEEDLGALQFELEPDEWEFLARGRSRSLSDLDRT